MLDFDEFGRWQGLFAVEVEVPLDRAFAVLFAHAAVGPEQQPELGVGAAFGCWSLKLWRPAKSARR